MLVGTLKNKEKERKKVINEVVSRLTSAGYGVFDYYHHEYDGSQMVSFRVEQQTWKLEKEEDWKSKKVFWKLSNNIVGDKDEEVIKLIAEVLNQFGLVFFDKNIFTEETKLISESIKYTEDVCNNVVDQLKSLEADSKCFFADYIKESKELLVRMKARLEDFKKRLVKPKQHLEVLFCQIDK